eukprot:TRINITY_DN5044_c0_g3_i1.p1 TRINITY_DN5044_c0_g3~~TRINITY_DN5044_c0_g3_i1.p1  ORF type:complete len:555 (-),score=89.41 TRINITY_DN5044_c0_g3_i1:315-1979(-)
MGQSSNKGSFTFGSVTRPLCFLAATAAVAAIALGFIVMPWLELPLRTAIQRHIWSSGIKDAYLDPNTGMMNTALNNNYNSSNISDSVMEGGGNNKVIQSNNSTSNTAVKEHIKGDKKSARPSPPVNVTSLENPNPKASIVETPLSPSKAQVPVDPQGDLHRKPGNESEIMKESDKTRSQTPLITFRNLTKETSKMTELGQCDLFQGRWVHDNLGPLYKNDSCPVLTQAQNCQGNGRSDKDYENWRWQPSSCDLPRFEARRFLEVMKGKTLAFIGDSVARNQMESMMCMLWQFEVPTNKGNKKMQRWLFRSHSVTVIRIWSSWLVHHSDEAFQFAPAGLTKLYLDKADESFMEFLPKIDVVVISSGHWFVKKSVFVYKENIVGGQLWWSDGHEQKMDSVEAFTIAMETALKAIVSHPDYKGLTILRTYSPDHYEGGAWNSGGSCTGKTSPYTDANLVTSGFTDWMLSHQLKSFDEAKKSINNTSNLVLLNITSMFQYRADGHPGPYRSPDPNKITKVGPNGRPPPQDCLHWCMPGPVDTWNELVAEIVSRNFNQQ